MKWISVKKKPAPEGETIFVWYGDDMYSSAFCNSLGIWECPECGNEISSKFACWLRPKPPKETRNDY